jgi:hypothetical protein
MFRAKAKHSKTPDASDPLHVVHKAEVTALWHLLLETTNNKLLKKVKIINYDT